MVTKADRAYLADELDNRIKLRANSGASFEKSYHVLNDLEVHHDRCGERLPLDLRAAGQGQRQRPPARALILASQNPDKMPAAEKDDKAQAITDILLEGGADPAVVNAEGHNALFFAKHSELPLTAARRSRPSPPRPRHPSQRRRRRRQRSSRHQSSRQRQRQRQRHRRRRPWSSRRRRHRSSWRPRQQRAVARRRRPARAAAL